MRDEEALQIGRKAVEDAQKRVGEDKNAIERELEQRMETEPEQWEAFALAGLLIQTAKQDTKH